MAKGGILLDDEKPQYQLSNPNPKSRPSLDNQDGTAAARQLKYFLIHSMMASGNRNFRFMRLPICGVAAISLFGSLGRFLTGVLDWGTLFRTGGAIRVQTSGGKVPRAFRRRSLKRSLEFKISGPQRSRRPSSSGGHKALWRGGCIWGLERRRVGVGRRQSGSACGKAYI